MTLADYLGVFLLGLLGSGHCIGMCGPFALAVSAGSANATAMIARQAAYQLGKATSYLFIGVVLLTLTDVIGARDPLMGFQNILAALAGTVMAAAGLAYAFEWRLPPMLARWWQGSAVCGAMSVLWRSPSLFKSLLIGWLNGFLPCGLSLTAIFYLVNYGKIEAVVAGSYVFGLGTLPGLLLLAFAGRKISLESRRWLMRATGVALVVFGVLTVLRGNPAVEMWFHQHLMFGGGMGGESGHDHQH
ncbi:MAG TPA: sulfite exporter TauE/SafE family protein [Rariglobus sp.]|jgi:sulfite exporter TauE/SafE|nr:sulfite exporter TauE/SafE family protein [Rariglobus sp.]